MQNEEKRNRVHIISTLQNQLENLLPLSTHHNRKRVTPTPVRSQTQNKAKTLPTTTNTKVKEKQKQSNRDWERERESRRWRKQPWEMQWRKEKLVGPIREGLWRDQMVVVVVWGGQRARRRRRRWERGTEGLSPPRSFRAWGNTVVTAFLLAPTSTSFFATSPVRLAGSSFLTEPLSALPPPRPLMYGSSYKVSLFFSITFSPTKQ